MTLFRSAAAAFVLANMLMAAPTLAQIEPEAAAQATIYSGEWAKKSARSGGLWSIYKEQDVVYIQLSDDFKTKRAPDLKLFLSPLSAAEANNKNATEGALLIAPLENHKGAQRYALPAGANLSSFRSVLIHCESYSKLWSAADLHPAS